MGMMCDVSDGECRKAELQNENAKLIDVLAKIAKLNITPRIGASRAEQMRGIARQALGIVDL